MGIYGSKTAAPVATPAAPSPYLNPLGLVEAVKNQEKSEATVYDIFTVKNPTPRDIARLLQAWLVKPSTVAVEVGFDIEFDNAAVDELRKYLTEPGNNFPPSKITRDSGCTLIRFEPAI